MAEHNSQYLIELDGNKPPEELFMVSAMFVRISQGLKNQKVTDWVVLILINIKNVFIF